MFRVSSGICSEETVYSPPASKNRRMARMRERRFMERRWVGRVFEFHLSRYLNG
jgi:hypothetical protein